MRVLGALLMAGALSSCGGADTSVPDVPNTVKTLMAAEFPADGQIHVQSRGKFVIGPDAMFCRLPNGLMIDDRVLSDLLRSLNQPTNLPSGYPRGNGKVGLDTECGRPGTIFTTGGTSSNRQGTPYKLVLAVWQGDPAKGGAVWEGGVERGPNTYLPCRPCFGEIVHGEYRGTDKSEHVRSSLNQDIEALGKSFVNSISQNTLQNSGKQP